MVYYLLLAAAVTCGCAAATTPDATAPRPEDGQARISVERGDTYVVRALFDSVSAEALTYRLEVVRDGVAGRSQSAQGGAFVSAAGRTDTLSTVRVSAAPGDRFEARLVVLRGDATVSETRLDETVQ